MNRFVVAIMLASSALAQVPRPAGTLLIGGKNVLTHRPAIIAFVSTQCGHCAAAAKVMQDVQKEFPGVFFGAVAFDEKADVAAWSKRLALTFPVYASDRSTALKFLGLPDRMLGTPQMVFIDKSGVIRAQSERLGSPIMQTPDYLRGLIKAVIKR